ncbi:MAG: carbohydrate porin [Escherichia sp.]
MATGVYNFDGFYGLTGGYSRVVFQHGRGLAAETRWVKTVGAGQTSTIPNHGAWCWITWPLGDWEISTFAYYQKDKTTAGGRKTPKAGAHQLGVGSARTSKSPKLRHAVRAGYEYLDDKNYKGVDGKGKGGLTKVTIAPTLTLIPASDAPAAALFVTYAKWDKVSDALDGNYDWSIIPFPPRTRSAIPTR